MTVASSPVASAGVAAIVAGWLGCWAVAASWAVYVASAVDGVSAVGVEDPHATSRLMPAIVSRTCGSSTPTAEPPSTAEATSTAQEAATAQQPNQPATIAATPAAPTGALATVMSELEGLQGQERTDRLVGLAQEGGGSVQWYTSMTDQLAQQLSLIHIS